jgi:hypothetical protein
VAAAEGASATAEREVAAVLGLGGRCARQTRGNAQAAGRPGCQSGDSGGGARHQPRHGWHAC